MSAEGAITVSGLTSLDTHTRVRWTRVCDHRPSKPEFSDCSGPVPWNSVAGQIQSVPPGGFDCWYDFHRRGKTVG